MSIAAPHDYTPALRTADLKPLIPHGNESTPKYQRALIYRTGLPPVSIQHAARGHVFALVYFGRGSRWCLKDTGKTIDELRPASEKLDAAQRRWRICNVITGLIVLEG